VTKNLAKEEQVVGLQRGPLGGLKSRIRAGKQGNKIERARRNKNHRRRIDFTGENRKEVKIERERLNRNLNLPKKRWAREEEKENTVNL